MTDEDTALLELGRSVLEELVVQAGLNQARAPAGAQEIHVALNFMITADAERQSLVIRGDRVGNTPLELRLSLT